MTKFAIRDDDINYFTRPEDLETLYGQTSHRTPVSLGVIPYVGGGKVWGVPGTYWETNRTFAIGDNKELVVYIKERLECGRMAVMLHGYSHRDWPRGAEFEVGDNLYDKVKEGKDYLEKIFNVRIRVFVPPHNRLSAAGTRAAAANRLNILVAYSLMPWERPFELATTVNALRIFGFWIRYQKKKRYPVALRFRRHQEFPCYTLTPKVRLNELTEGLDFVISRGGNFCLATHYAEMLANGSLATTLMDFLRYAETKYGHLLRYVSADKLFCEEQR